MGKPLFLNPLLVLLVAAAVSFAYWLLGLPINSINRVVVVALVSLTIGVIIVCAFNMTSGPPSIERVGPKK
jgi:hypothetical protein